MKKRVFCLLLALMLLCTVPAMASQDTAAFLRHFRYGQLTEYENMAFQYAVGIYGKFWMYSDEALEEFMMDLEENASEDDEELYDLRVWVSPDRRYAVEIQVKEPTYESFAVEVEKAAEVAAKEQKYYEPEQELKQLHDGILRDTPAGQMLETAMSYNMSDGEGNTIPVVYVYYDYYHENVEYIFAVTNFMGDYESAQAMLDEMMQTVRIGAGGAVM